MLLLQLHVRSLSEKTDVDDIMAHLNRLPEGLDAKYIEIEDRIKTQSKSRQELAIDVLQWLTFTFSPLDMDSLRQAIAIKHGDSNLVLDKIVSEEELQSACLGLVTLDKKTNLIHLVRKLSDSLYVYMEDLIHIFVDESTYDYLRYRTKLFQPEHTHACIAETCNILLSSPIWIQPYIKPRNALQGELGNLLKYASTYWGDHARHSNTLTKLVLKFLRKKESARFSLNAMMEARGLKLSIWEQLLSLEWYEWDWQDLLNECAAQCLAAYFSLCQVFQLLLDRNQVVPVDAPVWVFAVLGESPESINVLEMSLITTLGENDPKLVAELQNLGELLRCLLISHTIPRIDKTDGASHSGAARLMGIHVSLALYSVVIDGLQPKDCKTRLQLMGKHFQNYVLHFDWESIKD